MDHRYLFASNKYLKYAEVEEDIVGKHYFQTQMPGQEYVDEFKKISDTINETGLTATYFIITSTPKTKEKVCFFCINEIIINPHTNDKVGRFGEISPININFLGQIINLTNQFINNSDVKTSFNTKTSITKPQLTTREEEVLFLLLLGKSQKEIANILSKVYSKNIAVTTIGSIINRQLYDKFNAYSLSSLINNAIQLQAIQNIPSGLLKIGEGIFLINFI